ncbi:MAG: tripartite tricarboxylate transporter TctB family protein [Spirochaetales bacterium]|nr:tripartite tricarboxylate transporter TctB family protein [Spirochaetales bacterium]
MEDKQIRERSPEFLRARDRDLLFGVILTAASIALCIYAIRISSACMRILDATFYTAPGFLILIIGIMLLACAVYLIVNALRKGGSFRWLIPSRLWKQLRDDKAHYAVLAFFYLYLYMVLLWDAKIPFTRITFPFWANTMLFMMLIMFTFKVARPRTIIIMSVVTSILVYVTFKFMIGVPLP